MAWLEAIKLCPCLSYFPGFFFHFESLAFFENVGTNLTPKQSNIIFWLIFERYNNKVTIFREKKPVYFDKKMRTNLTADTFGRFFRQKNCFIVEKLWLFGLFSGDKGDNIDTWIIKITIKANQIDMDALLYQK